MWWVAVAILAIGVAKRVDFDTSEPVAVQPTVVEVEWECATWSEPVNINGYLLSQERCRRNNEQRFRLSYEGEVFIEDVYVNGVFLSRSIDTHLLILLSKPKPSGEKKSHEEQIRANMYREDA